MTKNTNKIERQVAKIHTGEEDMAALADVE